MIPLSVCIIGKNEENNIEKCLAPLVPYGFEIIYVDTGSTDRTKELAANTPTIFTISSGSAIFPPPEIFPCKKRPTTMFLFWTVMNF